MPEKKNDWFFFLVAAFFPKNRLRVFRLRTAINRVKRCGRRILQCSKNKQRFPAESVEVKKNVIFVWPWTAIKEITFNQKCFRQRCNCCIHHCIHSFDFVSFADSLPSLYDNWKDIHLMRFESNNVVFHWVECAKKGFYGNYVLTMKQFNSTIPFMQNTHKKEEKKNTF